MAEKFSKLEARKKAKQLSNTSSATEKNITTQNNF